MEPLSFSSATQGLPAERDDLAWCAKRVSTRNPRAPTTRSPREPKAWVRSGSNRRERASELEQKAHRRNLATRHMPSSDSCRGRNHSLLREFELLETRLHLRTPGLISKVEVLLCRGDVSAATRSTSPYPLLDRLGEPRASGHKSESLAQRLVLL